MSAGLASYVCATSPFDSPLVVGEQKSFTMVLGEVVPLPVPTVPVGLTLTPGDTNVNARWNPVNTAISYTLAWNINGGAYTEITGITGTGYLHTGLTNGATYGYKIKAVNTNGESNYSSVVNIIPDVPPEVPTNFSAT